MEKIILILALLAFVCGGAYADSLEQLCKDDLTLLESGILERTKANIERCLGDCGKAIQKYPHRTDLIITFGKIRWLYGLREGACEDFAIARDMGDGSVFNQFCHDDGSPKE